MNIPTVLLIEDDLDWMDIYKKYLDSDHYQVRTSTSVDDAFEILQREPIAVILTDLKIAGTSSEYGGFEILREAKALNSAIQIIVITAFGSQDVAIRATQEGALDYVTKPVDFEKLSHTIGNAIRIFSEKTIPVRDIKNNQSHSGAKSIFDQASIIGNSNSMEVVHKRIVEATQTDAPVLIVGELGVGKGMIAKSIHFNGLRREKPLLQTDVFYLERLQQRIFIRLLNYKGGTLFLEGLQQLTPETTKFALEVLRRCKVLDVRVILASEISDRDLDAMLESYDIDLSFRDLLESREIYISVPPLRKRKDGDDIASLTGHFLQMYSEETGRDLDISSSALSKITQLDFRSGNIRELRQLVNILAESVTKRNQRIIDIDQVKTHVPRTAETFKPVRPRQIFISYSRSDGQFVRQFTKDMESKELRFWIDVERITLGTEFWAEEIQRGLDSSDAMLLVVSPRSMSSPEVAREWNYFLERKRPIVVFIYEPADLNYRLRPIQQIFYSQDKEQLIKQEIVTAFQNIR